MNRTLANRITQLNLKNNTVVYENFVKCTVKDYEYNLSYNPTLLSGSQGVLVPYSASLSGNVVYFNSGSNYGILKDFATGSDFSPYVSTIGLYNDAGDLLAVAKMATPMPLSSNTDTTFLVKWDTQWIAKPYFTPSPSPSVTPSVTPSITPTISVTPSITPSITVTPTISVTPSVTPSTTPSISVTPSVTTTPSITVSPTPTVTPSKTPPPATATLTFVNYAAGLYTFNLSNAASGRIQITSAPVYGYESDCVIGTFEDDNLVSSITISAGASGNFIKDGAGFLTCSTPKYTLNSIVINGVTKTNGQTILVGSTTVTIAGLGTCRNYAC